VRCGRSIGKFGAAYLFPGIGHGRIRIISQSSAASVFMQKNFAPGGSVAAKLNLALSQFSAV
jgi:hypothetical protein